jgi:hypothetical protein
MSEDSLRQFLERLNSDAAWAEQVKSDPAAALEGYDLSVTERMAMACSDEDGLRRLAGRDVIGFGVAPIPTGPLCVATQVTCASVAQPCGSHAPLCGMQSQVMICGPRTHVACYAEP